MNTENFGKKILSIRQNANLTQEELALRMGVTPQAISKWERGQGLPDISILSDLCRLLNVSADLLLGLDYKNFTEDNDAKTQDVILQNLGICLDPAAIIFGVDLVQVFTDSPYAELMTAERMQMSKEGYWLPAVRIRDDLQLRPREFMVTIYDRVVYDERVEVIDDTALEHIIRTFGQEIRKKYGMLLSRDIAKKLMDNFRISCPELIEGVVPEKISYCLLQEVLKIFLSRGNAPRYLPRVIENLGSALYRNPDASVEQLAEQVCIDGVH